MAATGVDGTMYNVAPTGVNALLPPTLVNTSTSAATGNGQTNIVTSTTLPPGTYFVGGNFQIVSTTTFTNTDTMFFQITDTGETLTVYPLTALTGYNQIGSNPAVMAVTVSGILVLTTSTTLSWGVECAFANAANKTGYVGNAFYQRIS
jgi:hypothetical protein